MSCVLTLALDDAAQAAFERLRRAHFPPALNRIPAHLTLFHTLPEGAATVDALRACVQSREAFSLGPGVAKSMGRGVAFFFQSAEAAAVHRCLSNAFREHLTAQDRQGFRPHVVVQNKVSGDAARVCFEEMQRVILPEVTAVGLDLWRYLGGPWELLERVPFG